MTPQRLRNLIAKYGDYGIVLTAFYLFWSKFKNVIIALFFLISAMAFIFFCRVRNQNIQYSSEVSRYINFESGHTKQILQAPSGRLESALDYHYGKDLWHVEIWSPIRANNRDGYSPTFNKHQWVKFYRNSQFVNQINSSELGNEYGGTYISVKSMKTFLPSPVFAVRVESGMSNIQVKRFYTVSDNQFINMLELEGNNGGPIFKDFDKDGTPEWLFDDTDSQVHSSPSHFLIYRLTPEKTLKLWKKIANPTHRQLPNAFAK